MYFTCKWLKNFKLSYQLSFQINFNLLTTKARLSFIDSVLFLKLTFETGSQLAKLVSDSLQTENGLWLPVAPTSTAKCWDHRCAPHSISSHLPSSSHVTAQKSFTQGLFTIYNYNIWCVFPQNEFKKAEVKQNRMAKT